MAKNKTRKPNQGDNLRVFGDVNRYGTRDVCSYAVGESAQQPSKGQITQYGSRLVGPLSSAELRALAANLITLADALDATTYHACTKCERPTTESSCTYCGTEIAAQ